MGITYLIFYSFGFPLFNPIGIISFPNIIVLDFYYPAPLVSPISYFIVFGFYYSAPLESSHFHLFLKKYFYLLCYFYYITKFFKNTDFSDNFFYDTIKVLRHFIKCFIVYANFSLSDLQFSLLFHILSFYLCKV